MVVVVCLVVVVVSLVVVVDDISVVVVELVVISVVVVVVVVAFGLNMIYTNAALKQRATTIITSSHNKTSIFLSFSIFP